MGGVEGGTGLGLYLGGAVSEVEGGLGLALYRDGAVEAVKEHVLG